MEAFEVDNLTPVLLFSVTDASIPSPIVDTPSNKFNSAAVEVFPELVTKDENENLAVNYQGLVPVLINALKEQQKEIETYRNEVSELKNQFAEILNSN